MSCGVPLAMVQSLTGSGDGFGGFLYGRFHLSHIGLNEELQYVVGGHCRWVGVMEPVVEFALLHRGTATSFLSNLYAYGTEIIHVIFCSSIGNISP